MKYLLLLPLLLLAGCHPDSDDIQREQQEVILKQGSQVVGMPTITNFREKKLLKKILEDRDRSDLITYTYIFSEHTNKLIFLGESIGYGIPYATQYTNPLKREWDTAVVAQADPSGLFSPGSAEGTWIMLMNKEKKEFKPVYVENRVIVSPFKLSIE